MTGRTSFQRPSMQNIPIRTELGNKIRKALLASLPPFHSPDYAELERRAMQNHSSTAEHSPDK